MGIAKRLAGSRMIGDFRTDLRMDPLELMRRIEKKRNRVLKKQGGYLRTSMQRSMRYTSKADARSKPGSPPLAHKEGKGPLLRKLIVYAVDERLGSVVTGPKMLGRSRGLTKPLPQTLNEGGHVRPKGAARGGGLAIGKPGPMRFLGGDRWAYGTLETEAQLERAHRLAAEENSIREYAATKSVAQHIAPRPFTAPVLTDGGENFRKLLAREPL